MSHSLSLLLLLSLLLPLTLTQTLPHEDLTALLAFRESVNSPGSWSSGVTSLNLTGVSLEGCSYRPAWEAEQSNVTCTRLGWPCRLTGTLSPMVGNLTELESLVLPYNSLHGEVPKEISKLSRLQVLELQQNDFSGNIPEELGNLSSLQVLNLEGNSLEGPVPNLSSCRNLEQLRLGGNKLSGEIPSSFGNLPRLRHLSLPSNELNKPVPSELQGSCESLEYLDLGNNFFIRNIPAWLGNCSKLEMLILKSNYFLGFIPSELGRLSMLRVLDVSMNRLTGQVPASLGSCLELRFLVLANQKGSVAPLNCSLTYRWGTAMKQEFNQFPGPLPGSIAALPKLEIFWSPGAAVAGDIPDSWGACKSLRSLNLAGNNLTGNFPRGLGRCASLTYLDLSSNHLRGELPGELPTSRMAVFNVSMNSLSGRVPLWDKVACSGPAGGDRRSSLIQEDLVNPSWPFLATGSSYCDKLRGDSCASGSAIMHDLSTNNFSGSVPPPFIGDSLWEEQPGYVFLLSDNHFSGSIPKSFFTLCPRLTAFVVDLSNNDISTELPGRDIGGCASLIEFNASRNQIGKAIPTELGSLKNLTVLDLSHNQLAGPIPAELGELQLLKYLALSKNSLTGSIPEELSSASSLSLLDLSSNALSGGIPAGLGNLTHLEYLLLNNNSFSGTIPNSLIRLTSLVSVNFAFNNLSGSIPSAGSWAGLCDASHFQGNMNMSCPSNYPLQDQHTNVTNISPLHDQHTYHKRNTLAWLLPVVAFSTLLFLAMAGGLVKYTVSRARRTSFLQSFSPRGALKVFSLQQLLSMTNNFDNSNLIGQGGYSNVFKASWEGKPVAVKVMIMKEEAEDIHEMRKSFMAETKTLTRIRHRNIIKVLGYCWREDMLALVMEYMPNGSLRNYLATNTLNFASKLSIAMDVAQAVYYIHHEFDVPLIHCDLKPENVLLDSDSVAKITDFGISKLVYTRKDNTVSVSKFRGTIGYIPPEYAYSRAVSTRGDVFSYGILLLVMTTGKSPTDEVFQERGNFRNWVLDNFDITTGVEGGYSREEETEKLLIRIGLLCTSDNPVDRPTMKEILAMLADMGYYGTRTTLVPLEVLLEETLEDYSRGSISI